MTASSAAPKEFKNFEALSPSDKIKMLNKLDFNAAKSLLAKLDRKNYFSLLRHIHHETITRQSWFISNKLYLHLFSLCNSEEILIAFKKLKPNAMTKNIQLIQKRLLRLFLANADNEIMQAWQEKLGIIRIAKIIKVLFDNELLIPELISNKNIDDSDQLLFDFSNYYNFVFDTNDFFTDNPVEAQTVLQHLLTSNLNTFYQLNEAINLLNKLKDHLVSLAFPEGEEDDEQQKENLGIFYKIFAKISYQLYLLDKTNVSLLDNAIDAWHDDLMYGNANTQSNPLEVANVFLATERIYLQNNDDPTIIKYCAFLYLYDAAIQTNNSIDRQRAVDLLKETLFLESAGQSHKLFSPSITELPFDKKFWFLLENFLFQSIHNYIDATIKSNPSISELKNLHTLLDAKKIDEFIQLCNKLMSTESKEQDNNLFTNLNWLIKLGRHVEHLKVQVEFFRNNEQKAQGVEVKPP